MDFDLFTSAALPANFLPRVKRTFRCLSVAVTYRTVGQINLFISGIKFTFFAYPYPRVGRVTRYHGIAVASLRELAAMKALAIGQRLAFKDYVDWYFVLKSGAVSLAEVIQTAEKKFGHDFNSRLFLGQLVSLSDVPTQKISFLVPVISRTAIERFLAGTVRQYTLPEK